MADKPMLDHYIDIANEMIEQYRDLRLDQQKMDEVVRLKWQLPDGMPEWARAFRTTVPYDGIKAGVRVLSGLDEHITIDPYAFEENMLGDLVAAKERANLWEIALKWQMDRAARRKDSLRQGVIRSALMYDEIAGQIVHLPTQIKMIQKLGGNPNRQKAALRFGDFAVILRNPQQVYTRYSDYMLEAVMYVSVQDPQRIMDFWNNSELGQVIEDDYCPEDWLLFDYVDYNRRVVFCYPGKNVELISSYKVMEYFDAKGKKYSHDIPAIELLNEEWKFDFLPWAIANGGDGLVDTPEADRFPLLYGLIQSDQWNNTNILGSLVLSEAIAEAARPDVAKIGVNPDMVEGDHGEVGGAWRVPAGHEIKDMQQKSLDPALREAYDRGLSDMRGTSIPQVLVTAEMGPDEPFAGFNLRIQQAMAALIPYKNTAERWFEEAYRLMLYWVKEGGKPISAPGGAEIAPEQIDKERIYLGVTLEADVPIDKQQRMATAIEASRNLKIPTRDILEMLGETNPERKITEWMQEQLDMSYFQGVLQQIQMEASGAIEQAIQEGAQALAQQMVEQMVQQQVQGGGNAGGAEGGLPQDIMAQNEAAAAQAPTPFASGGLEGIGGQGFNPAAGGLPAAMAAPGATREAQTGMTNTGEGALGFGG